jgi:hypothetical protein
LGSCRVESVTDELAKTASLLQSAQPGSVPVMPAVSMKYPLER